MAKQRTEAMEEKIERYPQTYLLVLDEVGDWHKNLFMIGGCVFNLSCLWKIILYLREIKRNILEFEDTDKEFKWSNFTCKIKEIKKSNSPTLESELKKYKEYLEKIVYLGEKEIFSFFCSVVELPLVTLWRKWKDHKNEEDRKRCEIWVREKSIQDIVQRYFKWLEEKDGLGLILIDRTNNRIDELYFKKVRELIISGDNFYHRFNRIIPPFF